MTTELSLSPPWTGAAEPAPVTTRTQAGAVRGARSGGATAFLGVPYAEAPVGALRFASPRPPRSWTGLRDATRKGAPFLQDGMPDSTEDALLANVWTPSVDGEFPVLVYVHGGAWQVGAGSLPTYDGSLLAVEGRLVVVTFNYRLGPFGFGLHEDLADDETGLHANWGLQDQLALLEWVRGNAPAFGGDPGNITLAGTSAGGASAHQLSLLPRTRGVVRRVLAISAAHVRAPQLSMTAEHARESTEHLAATLGTTVRGLRSVPAGALLTTWNDLVARQPAHSGREYCGPVVDGVTMPGYDHDSPLPPVPVMSVHTRDEGTFFTVPGLSVLVPKPAPVDAAQLRSVVRRTLEGLADDVTDDLVAECFDVYRAAAADGEIAADPAGMWAALLGDSLLRHRVLRQAQRHAAEGRTPVHAMEFAHPALPPGVGAPHEATSKFLFGTHSLPANARVFGDGPLERRIGACFRELVASFATEGAPSGVDWPALGADGEGLLVLGGPDVAVVGSVEPSDRLAFFDRPALAPWPTPRTTKAQRRPLADRSSG